MTTGTNGTAPAPEEPSIDMDAPMIPAHLAERFSNGEGTQEDLDVALSAGSDTPPLPPQLAHTPTAEQAQAAVSPPATPEPEAPSLVNPDGTLNLSAITMEHLSQHPEIQAMQARERQYMQSITQNNQRGEQDRIANAERQWAANEAVRLQQENPAITPALAKQLADRDAAREAQAYRQNEGAQQANAAKLEYARHYGNQYGVPVDSLLQYNTQTEMEMGAKIAKMEAARADPASQGNPSGVPAQSYENGLTAGGGDPWTRMGQIGRGEGGVISEADMAVARKLGILPSGY